MTARIMNGSENPVIRLRKTQDTPIYFGGWDSSVNMSGVFRVHSETGNRELVTHTPDLASGLAIWPESSFFPPAVAGLSIAAGALLVAVLAGVARRRAPRNGLIGDRRRE